MCGEEGSLQTYEDRLLTYIDWRYDVNPSELAQAGFYYTKKADIVRCIVCFCEFDSWHKGDDPLADHYRYAKHCDLAKILWKCRHFDSKAVKKQETPFTKLALLAFFSISLLLTAYNILKHGCF
jgi:hypothetical protein